MLTRFRSAFTSAVNNIREREAVPPDDCSDEPPVLPPLKYAYSRPDFLGLGEDEFSIAVNRTERPILLPRNTGVLPGHAGYAEAVNAGKSPLNEDQAQAVVLPICPPLRPRDPTPLTPNDPEGAEFCEMRVLDHDGHTQHESKNPAICTTYFGLFDGHAGTGAAVFARHVLHLHLKEKLTSVYHLILQLHKSRKGSDSTNGFTSSADHNDADERAKDLHQVMLDDMICGALEDAFLSLDNQIERELTSFTITGGCTAVVAFFAFGKLYVANAGDSRAVLVRKGVAVPMSEDFTPSRDRQRMQCIAMACPSLLGDTFHHLEFSKRILRRDIGTKVLYRNGYMTGWGQKTVMEEDRKLPLVYGAGKKTRLMGTIGVSRGFGDFTLRVYDTKLHVKPFMTAAPEVRVYNPRTDHVDIRSDTAGLRSRETFSEPTEKETIGPNDVVILGTDGLWDMCSNSQAAEIVTNFLVNCSPDDETRYSAAAQELLMYSRGTFQNGSWRMQDNRLGSGDDISIFVVPLSLLNEPHLLA